MPLSRNELRLAARSFTRHRGFTAAAVVSLAQGDSDLPPYPTLPGTQTLTNGALAIVEHDDQGAPTLDWTPPGYPGSWMIRLQSVQGCPGSQPLSLDTLLKIANSLH